MTARLGYKKEKKERRRILKEAVRQAQIVKEPRAAHDRHNDRLDQNMEATKAN
jgi:hypothetical protein